MSINCGPDHNHATTDPATKNRHFRSQSNVTGTAASIELSAPLRYTGTRLRPREQGLPGPFTRLLQAVPD
jgi:hypothetical protein